MEKKMYYLFDGGDTPIYCTKETLMDMLEAEASNYNEEKYSKDGEPAWTITLAWLTDEEYEALPEP